MGVACVRFSLPGSLISDALTLVLPPFRKKPCLIWPASRRNYMNPTLSTSSTGGSETLSVTSQNPTAGSVNAPFRLQGVEEALMGFISGNVKATELAHSVWKNVIQKGDTVVDATCGNGYDTLALLKMVADESRRGSVYGMDIQKSALDNTSALLSDSVSSNERELVKLFPICHSKMEQVIPKDAHVRLVAFNLGYLPGGNKEIITMSQTTLLALQAASRILDSRGLISVVVYVGHHGGREELETVQAFASGLPVESWVSCKLETLNRPDAPILILLSKK